MSLAPYTDTDTGYRVTRYITMSFFEGMIKFGLNLTYFQAVRRGQSLLPICKTTTSMAFKDPTMMLPKTTGPMILQGGSSVGHTKQRSPILEVQQKDFVHRKASMIQF